MSQPSDVELLMPHPIKLYLFSRRENENPNYLHVYKESFTGGCITLDEVNQVMKGANRLFGQTLSAIKPHLYILCIVTFIAISGSKFYERKGDSAAMIIFFYHVWILSILHPLLIVRLCRITLRRYIGQCSDNFAKQGYQLKMKYDSQIRRDYVELSLDTSAPSRLIQNQQKIFFLRNERSELGFITDFYLPSSTDDRTDMDEIRQVLRHISQILKPYYFKRTLSLGILTLLWLVWSYRIAISFGSDGDDNPDELLNNKKWVWILIEFFVIACGVLIFIAHITKKVSELIRQYIDGCNNSVFIARGLRWSLPGYFPSKVELWL